MEKVFQCRGDQQSKEKRTSFQDVTPGSELARSSNKNFSNDITYDFNRSRNENKNVHPRTVQRFLHAQEVKRRVVRKKMDVSQINRKKRVSWCLEKRKLTFNNYWNTVIFADESQIVLGENYRVYVWRTLNEAYLSRCMCPPRQRRVSIMLWNCLTYCGVGTLCLVNGNINAEKYISVLENYLWPVIAQHFSN